MAVVQKFGKPDLFVTMTCNPNWKEIQDELYPGQTAQDRPDITTRIFHSKCEELKKDLFVKGVLGKVVAHVHVIEFQKRGLPHAHLLLILDHADKLHSPDDYDSVVRAEIPDKVAEPDLFRIVMRHMIHGPCGKHIDESQPCLKEGICKKFFPKAFAEFTVEGLDSYPTYRRRRNGPQVKLHNRIMVDNRWVVPYNPWLLRKYDCHINVEVCSTIKCVKYLYKYVYKGSDRCSLQINDNCDDVKQFVDGRWICPQEALW
ncbi:DNA helicase [Ranunculus cassubicifolius]